jgi:hypothetical protein
VKCADIEAWIEKTGLCSLLAAQSPTGSNHRCPSFIGLSAILPRNNLDASEAFYAKAGFVRMNKDAEYRVFSDGKSAELHLTPAVKGWLIPGRNPFGLYLRSENVDELAGSFGNRLDHKAENKPAQRT